MSASSRIERAPKPLILQQMSVADAIRFEALPPEVRAIADAYFVTLIHDAYERGWDEGYSDSELAGKAEYDDGRTDGYDDGYHGGYEDGYRDGQRDKGKSE